MTDKEILKAAIERGYPNSSGASDAWREGYLSRAIKEGYNFIFSHDFAKSVFGEKPAFAISAFESTGIEESGCYEYNGGIDQSAGRLIAAWQYHLQQMVIKEKPLAYLARFMEKEKAPERA
jgi:hypothetical protein